MTWNMINTCNLISSLVVLASLAAVHHLRKEEVPSFSKAEMILLGLSLIVNILLSLMQRRLSR